MPFLLDITGNIGNHYHDNGPHQSSKAITMVTKRLVSQYHDSNLLPLITDLRFNAFHSEYYVLVCFFFFYLRFIHITNDRFCLFVTVEGGERGRKRERRRRQ